MDPRDSGDQERTSRANAKAAIGPAVRQLIWTNIKKANWRSDETFVQSYNENTGPGCLACGSRHTPMRETTMRGDLAPHIANGAGDPVRSAFLTGVQLLEAGRASLLLRDETEPVLLISTSVGIDPAILASIRVPVGHGIAGIVAERGISLFGSCNGSTFISAPVVTDRGVEGVLNLTDRLGGKQYTAEHVAQASSVATHIGHLLQFSRLAARDAVSGLPNRQAFEASLAREIARSKRTGSPFAVVFIDLDNLKAVNDRFGHSKGDEVIQNVGAALQRVLRPYDFAGRYGGDEFALLLGAPSDTDSGIAWRIADAVGRIGEQLGVGISISVGVAHCPVDGTSAEELIARADSRMYENKRAKKAAT